MVPRYGGQGLDNTKALNDFLTEVERRAFKMAQFATGNPEDAIELVQESMFKLVDKYGDRGPAEWGPLFQRILQSRIRDWYRRDGVRRRVLTWLRPGSGRDDAETGMDRFADPMARESHERLHTDRLIDRLIPALQGLPLRQRQVFLLRAWEGLDVRATADAVGCSEGSVKTHYSRALNALRTRLGEWNGDADGR